MIYKNIIELINAIKDNIKELDLEKDEKENILDDVEVVEEQVQRNITKPARIKKHLITLKIFLLIQLYLQELE